MLSEGRLSTISARCPTQNCLIREREFSSSVKLGGHEGSRGNPLEVRQAQVDQFQEQERPRSASSHPNNRRNRRTNVLADRGFSRPRARRTGGDPWGGRAGWQTRNPHGEYPEPAAIFSTDPHPADDRRAGRARFRCRPPALAPTLFATAVHVPAGNQTGRIIFLISIFLGARNSVAEPEGFDSLPQISCASRSSIRSARHDREHATALGVRRHRHECRALTSIS